MLSFLAAAAILLLGAARAASNSHRPLPDLQLALRDLAETLKWDDTGKTHAVYTRVFAAAEHASRVLNDTAGTASTDPGSSRSLKCGEMLGRLTAESRYFVSLSAPADYKQTFADNTMFLTGAVDEWRFAVLKMAEELQEDDGDDDDGDHDYARPRGRRRNEPQREDYPMATVPPGCYVAGSSEAVLRHWEAPPETWANERPQRRVCIDYPVSFGLYEVTLGAFDRFLAATGYRMRGGCRWWEPYEVFDPNPPLDTRHLLVFNPALNHTSPGFPQTADSPVVCVRRQDAEAYAAWLSGTEPDGDQRPYRLPTEDEWAWAAAGRSASTDLDDAYTEAYEADNVFPWGSDLHQAGLHANTYDASAAAVGKYVWPPLPVNDTFAYTAPVGSFRPNGFGLYDMIGNAREFMADDWVTELGNASRNDGSPHRFPVQFRVVRGGAWLYQARNYRLAYRDGYLSSETATNLFGFRLVRDL